MSNIKNFILAITVAVLVTGCSAIDKQIKHGKLDVQTKMSETVFLDPVCDSKKTVLIQIRNTSDKQDLNIYLKKVIEFSFNANKYFNDLEPWALKKTNIKRMNSILYTIVTQIKNISILLSPIIPISSDKILDIMNLKKEDRLLKSINNNNIFNHDLEFKKTSILFKKIENDN
jgi:methionyl-tRNA synthetase